jgi:glycosyltransferase involved in cell wall biosynthesis
MPVENVWVIMPVYNEEEALPLVLDAWLPVLIRETPQFTLLILNDGSKDGSLDIARKYEKNYPRIKIIDKKNSGHGQSCVLGYKTALEQGAEWIFQIDSDGQCNPAFYAEVVANAEDNKVVYGYRKTRADGFQRYLVSRVVSLFVFAATGVWVRDANVPYRFMHCTAIKDFIDAIPGDFYLSNILVSTLQAKNFGIKWVNIHFDDRCGGTASVKNSVFMKHGIRLFRQLRSFVRTHKLKVR